MKIIKIFTVIIVMSAGLFITLLHFSPNVEMLTAYAKSSHDEQVHSDESNEHDEHKEESTEGDKHKGHDEHSEENIIDLTDDQMKEFNIELDSVRSGRFNTYITLPGEILINPDRLVHIVPRVAGIVREVRKTLGDNVQEGEIMAVLESAELGKEKLGYLSLKQQLELAQIDMERTKVIHDNTAKMLELLKNSPTLKMIQKKIRGLDMGKNRGRLISAYAKMIMAKDTYNMEKNLYEKKISSNLDFLKSEKEYESAYAEYLTAYDEISFTIKRQLFNTKRAISIADSSLYAAERSLQILGLTETDMANLQNIEKHNINLARVEIRAPFPGTVIEKHITLGEILKDDSKAFVIADLGTVWANLNLYQKDLPFIQKGQTVTIVSGHGIDNVEGNISWVSPIVEEETRTARARVVISNKNGRFLPGLFVTGKVAVGKDITSVLIIAKSAIQSVDGKASVFIKTDKGFKPQPIITGRDGGNEIEILSGLNSGQQYVKTGAFTLKAQLAKGSFGDGHNH